MQEQTPIPTRKKSSKKASKKASRNKPVRGTKIAGNNPYGNVQPKSNNLPGFSFGGSVM